MTTRALREAHRTGGISRGRAVSDRLLGVMGRWADQQQGRAGPPALPAVPSAEEERRAQGCGVEPVARHHVPGPRGRLGQAQLQVARRGRAGGAGGERGGGGPWRGFVRGEGEAGGARARAGARRCGPGGSGGGRRLRCGRGERVPTEGPFRPRCAGTPPPTPPVAAGQEASAGRRRSPPARGPCCASVCRAGAAGAGAAGSAHARGLGAARAGPVPVGLQRSVHGPGPPGAGCWAGGAALRGLPCGRKGPALSRPSFPRVCACSGREEGRVRPAKL